MCMYLARDTLTAVSRIDDGLHAASLSLSACPSLLWTEETTSISVPLDSVVAPLVATPSRKLEYSA